MLNELINPNESSEVARKFVDEIKDAAGVRAYVKNVASGKMLGYSFSGLDFRYDDWGKERVGLLLNDWKIGSFEQILRVIPDYAHVSYFENITENTDLVKKLLSTPIRYATNSLHLKFGDESGAHCAELFYHRGVSGFKNGMGITISKEHSSNVSSMLKQVALNLTELRTHPADYNLVFRNNGSLAEAIDDAQKIFDDAYKKEKIPFNPILELQISDDHKSVKPLTTKDVVDAAMEIERAKDTLELRVGWKKDGNCFSVESNDNTTGSREILIVSDLDRMEQTVAQLFNLD